MINDKRSNICIYQIQKFYGLHNNSENFISKVDIKCLQHNDQI